MCVFMPSSTLAQPHKMHVLIRMLDTHVFTCTENCFKCTLRPVSSALAGTGSDKWNRLTDLLSQKLCQSPNTSL